MSWTEACKLTASERRVWAIAFGEYRGQEFDWNRMMFVDKPTPAPASPNPKW